MLQTRKSNPAVPREVIEECLQNKCLKTLEFMIQNDVIDVVPLFTSPTLDKHDAWFLTRIFFNSDRDRSLRHCDFWKTLLPCMLNTLLAKGLIPHIERTRDLLQLIACNDFTEIEYWLDNFARWYEKSAFTKMINELIVMLPDFTKMGSKEAYYFDSFHLDGFNHAHMAHTQYFHQVGNNLLAAFIFFKKKGGDDKYKYNVAAIQALIQKYSLDINAPNKTVEPYRGDSYYKDCDWYKDNDTPSDMTATYQTTFARVLNVVFQYDRGGCEMVLRFKEIIKLLMQTCDTSELENILHWYNKVGKKIVPELLASIPKLDDELNLSAMQRQARMRECAAWHRLFHNEDLLPVIQGYLDVDVPKKKRVFS